MHFRVNRRVGGWLSRKFRGRDMRRAAEKADVTPQSPTEFRSEWENASLPGLTGWLFRRICHEQVVQKRRKNFAALLEAVAACQRITPLIPHLVDGACPGFFRSR
jgi:hypothetical protein